jgi:hypothetical protein
MTKVTGQYADDSLFLDSISYPGTVDAGYYLDQVSQDLVRLVVPHETGRGEREDFTILLDGTETRKLAQLAESFLFPTKLAEMPVLYDQYDLCEASPRSASYSLLIEGMKYYLQPYTPHDLWQPRALGYFYSRPRPDNSEQVVARFTGSVMRIENDVAYVVLKDEEGREGDAECDANQLYEAGIYNHSDFTYTVKKHGAEIIGKFEPFPRHRLTKSEWEQIQSDASALPET